MVATINGFIIFCLIFTSAYFIGLLTFFADNEKDKCDMTYMFELPQYTRISNDFDEQFPKYSLHYYDEGPPNIDTPKFWGIPVLFIPGNAGSHKQARSLASVALRKAINKRLPYHLDYFTINMNEELTGLSGIFLKDQLDYVNRSLYFILKLYKNQKSPPKSVVLIGHSMGGVIARKLAQMSSSPVEIVITLASPHKRSPIILDSYISDFYQNVKDPIRPKVTFINLSGGYSDLLVPTTLTDSKDNASLYVVTTHIPRSWAAADHKQILWCKQTVLVLTRCLFDCVDFRTRQIIENSEDRMKIFQHHLIRHSGTNAKFRERYNNNGKTVLDENGEWIEKLPRHYSVRFLKGTKKLQWYMVKLVDDPKHEMLTIVALNLKTVDWVFACGAYIPKNSYKICEKGIHLTQLSSIDPSARYKRRSITVSLHDLKRNFTDELSHVIFKVAPTQEPVVFHVDIYNGNDRRVDFKLPSWFDVGKKTIIKETAQNSLRYEIYLPDLTHVIQSFNVYLRSFKCSSDSHHATVSLVVPWGNEESHKHFTDSDMDQFHLRLYNSKPNGTENAASLRLTLDPTCRYEISIRRSIVGSLSQLARFYTPVLIVNVATVVLLILKSHLHSLGSDEGGTTFFAALKGGTKPYYVLGLARLGTAVFGISTIFEVFPISNWYLLKEEGTDFILLPYIMYMISIGIVWIVATVITVWITVCESAIHKFFLKFLNKTMPFTIIWSDYMIAALQKIPFLVSTSIVFISYNTCGGLALALGSIFYFLKLTQMSQDYIEETVFTYVKSIVLKYTSKREKKKEADSKSTKDENDKALLESRAVENVEEEVAKKTNNIQGIPHIKQQVKDQSEMKEKDIRSTDLKIAPPRAISFHGVMFLIWLLTTVINAPSVITWARNFKYSNSLNPDPSFLPGFILSLCTIPLWQFDMPNPKKRWYDQVSRLIFVIAVLGLIYAPIYIFRLNYLLSAVVLIVVGHQMFAPNVQEVSRGEKEKVEEDLEKYENIKKKLE